MLLMNPAKQTKTEMHIYFKKRNVSFSESNTLNLNVIVFLCSGHARNEEKPILVLFFF